MNQFNILLKKQIEKELNALNKYTVKDTTEKTKKEEESIEFSKDLNEIFEKLFK